VFYDLMKLTVGRVVFGGDNWVNYYDLPWGTMVGMNYLLESGVPRSTLASQKNINLFPNGRGHLAGRPRFSPVDLLLQQHVRLSRSLRVSIGVNALNVFDQKIETSFIGTPYRDQFQRRRRDVLRASVRQPWRRL
jgi:hypothetical protein